MFPGKKTEEHVSLPIWSRFWIQSFWSAGLYLWLVVVIPAQSVWALTWVVKNHGWPHFLLKTQNASVLECALEPKHSGAQGTLSTPLSDDKNKTVPHQRKLLWLKKKPANSWGLVLGKSHCVLKWNQVGVAIQGIMRHKLASRLWAEA